MRERTRGPSSSLLAASVILCATVRLAAPAAAQATPPTRPASAKGLPPQERFTPLPGANVVNVIAREYAFEMPTSIPAGLTTFRLLGKGKELHYLSLTKLEQGKTVSDFRDSVMAGMAAAKAGRPRSPRPTWMQMVGGAGMPAPGSESNVTLLLEPGDYVAVCGLPAPDGTSHLAHGMFKAFSVAPSAHAAAPLPKADLMVTLTDYAFTFSRPLTRVSHVIGVTNAASQPHEMIITRLPPGVTNQRYIEWERKPQGPRPAEPFGGTLGIRSGATVWIQGSFPPGRYGLICFIRDAKDRRPHYDHGMQQEIVVQ